MWKVCQNWGRYQTNSKHYETNSVRTPSTHQGLSNGIKSQEHAWQEAMWFRRSKCDKQNKQTTFRQ